MTGPIPVEGSTRFRSLFSFSVVNCVWLIIFLLVGDILVCHLWPFYKLSLNALFQMFLFDHGISSRTIHLNVLYLRRLIYFHVKFLSSVSLYFVKSFLLFHCLYQSISFVKLIWAVCYNCPLMFKFELDLKYSKVVMSCLVRYSPNSLDLSFYLFLICSVFPNVWTYNKSSVFVLYLISSIFIFRWTSVLRSND